MKKLFLTIALTTIISSQLYAEDLIVSGLISENRNTVEMLLQNGLDDDLFCAHIELEVEFCNSNFCEVVGQTRVQRKDVYVDAGEEKSLSFTNVTDVIRRNHPEAIVNRILNMNTSSCELAQFKHYCEFAQKSPEEKHTVVQIQEWERLRDCDLPVEKMDVVKLDESGISDLTPFKYLYNLERLSLKGNQVSDLSPLYGLNYLWKVKIDENPVNDISELLKMPEITRVTARRTQLLPVEGPLSPSLKYIDIGENTPACESLKSSNTPYKLHCW